MDPHSITLVILVDVELDGKIGSWAIILLLFSHFTTITYVEAFKTRLLKKHSALKIQKKRYHILGVRYFNTSVSSVRKICYFCWNYSNNFVCKLIFSNLASCKRYIFQAESDFQSKCSKKSSIYLAKWQEHFDWKSLSARKRYLATR